MMIIENIEVEVIKGDITSLELDSIVNAANNKLIMGGGLAGVIKKNGGQVIENEALAKGPIDIGGAIYTSAGRLPSKYVIHAATMGMDFKTDEFKVRSSCKSSLEVAKELGIESIAIPALGCGVGKFPFLACAKIIAQEIFRFSIEDKSNLKKIIICLYNNEAFQIFEKCIYSYLNFIKDKLQRGPFLTVDVIIKLKDKFVIIKRSNPPFGWALPGGFVDYNESLERAAVREAKEETGLDLYDLVQFHTYSRPQRDPRFHSVNTVFVANARGTPKADSDASDLKVIAFDQIEKIDFAFDHRDIIKDYVKTQASTDLIR